MVEQMIVDFLVNLAQQHPVGMTALMVLGICRAVFKPAIVLLDQYVLATPSVADDKWEREFKEGKVYFVLDYLFSIKIPEKLP